MKQANILIGLLTATFMVSASATVTIHYDHSIEMLAVNQQLPTVEKQGMFSSTETITLPDGESQIVFRYEPIFDHGGDPVSIVGPVIIAKFTASDINLNLTVPNFRNARTAEAEIQTLAWSLVDDDGNVISHSEDQLVKYGVQLGRDFVAEAIQYNRTGGVAAISPLPSMIANASENQSVTQTEVVVPTKVKSSEPNNTAEEMLHFWYEKADAETRARFKAFVNNN